jgi:asparagine synthase (glutamine-hydrolysing)
MCGILGIINLDGQETRQAEHIRKMTAALKHRGPDDEGFLFFNHKGSHIFSGDDTPAAAREGSLPGYYPRTHIDNAKGLKSRLVFGYRRLAILDLTLFGHQPMSFLNRYWIVFNGEIYNYIELKNQLQREGVKFYSRTDTEVVMAAYHRWGSDCLNKFNGMWAFAIYDRVKNKIFISRDRFGIKPLVYYLDNEKIVFASEIKAILKHPGVRTAPGSKYIGDFLKMGPREDLKETAFENIYRFNPASFLEIRLDRFKPTQFNEQKFWEKGPNLETQRFDEKKAKDYSNQYVELLEDSVKLRLRADVEIGSAFSGGLDSSSIVYIIHRLLKEKNSPAQQKTFSTVYKSAQFANCDESNFIDQLCNRLNIKSFQIEPRVDQVLNEYRRMVYAMDTPQESSLMSYMFTYKLVASEGIKVTLDGQGADELQAGYLPHLVNYFSHLALNKLGREARQFKKIPGANTHVKLGIMFNILRRFSLDRFFPGILRSLGKYNNPFIPLNQRLYTSMTGNLITLFHYGDRSSMAYSVESRFPFMDYRLVEFWLSLADVYKVHNGWTKYCARIALEGKLPDNITWRKDKMGWKIPQDQWFRGELKEWFINIIASSPFLKELGRGHDVRQKLNRTYKNSKPIKKLIRLLNLALWHEIFFQGNGGL